MLARLWETSIRFIGKLQQEDGQDLVEYGLVLLLVVIALVASLQGTANPVVAIYNHINSLYP